ncbi:hypothetical protein [Nocardia sp. NBC_01388]
MINAAKLTEIEAALTNDTLTDAELAEQLHAAGLPEVARVLAQATRR